MSSALPGAGDPPRRVTLRHGALGPVDPVGTAAERRAVRAVVHDDAGRVLMLRTARGAVKFPGGGVEPGESDEEALRREVREECGLEVVEVLAELGEIVEVSKALPEDPFDLFHMTSRYLACRVGADPGPVSLSAAETALGLRTEWIAVQEAVEANAPFAASSDERHDHRFALRETVALGWLRRAT